MSLSESNQQTSAGIGLDDIYYILFKHKWKIVASSILGLVAAVSLFLLHAPMYESDAKLLVRYIVDSKSVTSINEPETRSTASGGDSIINSETEILNSFDLLLAIVDVIGADKILAKAGGGGNRVKAAELIRKNLDIQTPPKSNIIRLTLRHPDPELVRTILSELVDAYLKKHLEVHRSVGIFDDFLSQQTDELRSRLAQTEEDLRKLKTKAGVISFDDAKRSLTAEMGKIREGLLETEAELAARESALNELEKLVPIRNETNAVQFGAPLEKINEYKGLISRLDSLVKKQEELQNQFTEESTAVITIRKRIEEALKQKESLEKNYPKLSTLSLPPPTLDATQRPDPRLERSKVIALQSKMTMLSGQLDKIRKEAVSLDDIAGTVAQLERKKQLEETNYRYYSASLEQARIDETLGTSRMSNINKVQAPSPPLRDLSKLKKNMILTFAGGIILGIVLAFFLELFVDQTIKRPKEIENSMGLPVFLSVPDLTKQLPGASKSLLGKFRKPLQLKHVSGGLTEGVKETLLPYYDALRDRVVMFFEASNITRKPKLIGVTSCSEKAGVSTMAAGLAASLSNTGEGRVLLIDLNLKAGAVHPFSDGAPVQGLLEMLDDTQSAGSQLDVVSGVPSQGTALSVRSKQFTDLLPRLKASHYDYIVFDLPPIHQTSATIRLAGFMDTVLMVFEAGQTDRRLVKRSLSYLKASNPNVAGILNKAPCVVPRWLQPEA